MAARLLEQAREILRKSVPHRFHNRKIKGLYLFLTRYMPSKSQSRQQQVKARFRTLIERVFSLFEPHTELIKRGRRQKPVEFGHKVLLCETAEKFITDYEVHEKQLPDCNLTQPDCAGGPRVGVRMATRDNRDT